MKHYQDIIVQIADILKATHIQPEHITKCLTIIKEALGFQRGMIYEVNSLDEYCLMEHIPVDVEKKTFSIERFPKQDIEHLLGYEYQIISKEDENSDDAKQWLEIFDAETLLLIPAVDEEKYIYGFIAFSSNVHPSLSEDDMNCMMSSILILLRCVHLRMYKRKLEQAQITMESILDNTGIDIYVNDFYNHDILYVNKSMAAPYGGREQFMGKKCWEVLFPGQGGPCEFCPQKHIVDENGSPTKVYTWDYQRAFDGSWFRVFSSAFRWVDGRLAHVVSSADITDNKRNEALIENLANYDQLTKLPNRRMLLNDCEHRIDKATITEKGYILFFDIDNFKSINDTLGHDAGDDFLIQLGEFFSSIPLLKDAIYRNGGDEFVAVIGGEDIQKSNIQILANFILERFRKPWKLKKGTVFCNTSIGISCFPEDGTNAEILIQKADMAMYKIKKAGGGDLCFAYELVEQ